MNPKLCEGVEGEIVNGFGWEWSHVFIYICLIGCKGKKILRNEV
jgi:hypothetical protein